MCSLIHLASERNPNFQSVTSNKLQAIMEDADDIDNVTRDLNTLHAARSPYIKSESDK